MEVIINPTENQLETVLAGRDDNLESITPGESAIEPSNPDPNPDPSVPTPNAIVTPESPDSNATPVPDEQASEGLTANDLANQETPPETLPEQPAPANLDPESQYIVDNLPDITARITKDGQVQEINVKSWTQLPQDVEFASKRDELAFMNALTAQENKAAELQRTYQSNQQQTQTQEFEQRENASIREDLTKLQNENKLPKFKEQPDSAGFNDDPATKEVQKVLDFMNQRNNQYLENYNKGGSYRHIGFEEAFEMMPSTKETQVKNQRQAQEDTERQTRAGRVGGSATGDGLNMQKPTVKQGMSLDSIVERIENTW